MYIVKFHVSYEVSAYLSTDVARLNNKPNKINLKICQIIIVIMKTTTTTTIIIIIVIIIVIVITGRGEGSEV